jgi:hypothetical protein
MNQWFLWAVVNFEGINTRPMGYIVYLSHLGLYLKTFPMNMHLNSLNSRMICSKFNWHWPGGFWIDSYFVFTLSLLSLLEEGCSLSFEQTWICTKFRSNRSILISSLSLIVCYIICNTFFLIFSYCTYTCIYYMYV